MNSQIQFHPELVRRLVQAQHVVVLTGAGVSAESGIPTFRDAQTGLWAKYDPQELATPEAFARNPRLVWDWYAWRREAFGAKQPNPAHYALSQLEQLVPRFTLITQNIDNLHQLAGSQNIVALHGNIARVKCSKENIVIDDWKETANPPPLCPRCKAYLRPDVVWFGERLPAEALQQAIDASQNCDVFLSIGTSGVVEPAASMPSLAYRSGAVVLVNNLDVVTRDTPPIFGINGPAGHVLPALLKTAFNL